MQRHNAAQRFQSVSASWLTVGKSPWTAFFLTSAGSFFHGERQLYPVYAKPCRRHKKGSLSSVAQEPNKKNSRCLRLLGKTLLLWPFKDGGGRMLFQPERLLNLYLPHHSSCSGLFLDKRFLFSLGGGGNESANVFRLAPNRRTPRRRVQTPDK